MTSSSQKSIESFLSWKDSLETIKGIARQFSHLTGLSMSLKDAVVSTDGEMVASYAVRPKPLKWKGSQNWNTVIIKIREDGTFAASIGGEGLIGFRPGMQWSPVRKAMEMMEKIHEKIKKESRDEG